ncbi:AAA family ATPase [Archangium gephyra]|uniref:AAA family ATPase n=1 Tax=Archangium gephyra TaxID=48 RepID=UPI0035D49A57
MLRLKRLEVQGFGPFADQQVIEFPNGPGVTVIYGENMRGKTSLLNAIRYAFFGTVVGRGSRPRRLHTISNRELASDGQYGFNVALTFDYDGAEYELVRECIPRVKVPASDEDYSLEVLLRKGNATLGPQEREKALQQVFPREVSRFFLFDGELLQEYEELLINESEAGHRISEAIERILGVPILKRGRAHLTQLSEDADKAAAKEASKRQETQALGTALQQATEQKEAHQKELARKQQELNDLNAQKLEVEQVLQSMQKYASILQERDEANARLDEAGKEEKSMRGDLQRAMGDGWRSLLRDPVRAARTAAQAEAQKEFDAVILSLRAKAIESGHCGTCEQDVPPGLADKLRSTLPAQSAAAVPPGGVSAAMSRLADLNKFNEADNAGEVRQLWKRLEELRLEQVTLRDRISDLTAALSDSEPETLRRSKTSYAEVIEKISVVKRAIDEESKKADEKDQNIQRLKKKLEAAGTSDLRAGQLRAKILRDASEVFGAAVERYKSDLRGRVEATASELFLSMTTEKQDFAGLTINEGYGLTIRHRDSRAEEARSAGAEHVVALALMGALQRNAPLRGPIVMDSPFGRLDENHTANVIETLPKMAEQVVLLVYEAEVGRARMRDLLGSQLVREYELNRVSARRTNVREVK